ncbi:DNA cytosine methyltransferase [Luteolibacter algae]|uniref:DNA (cytosine-5-)-methyltransferase n=1 Tax=Luteolibacter algae TaxID=454151 RepID=A0ABW5DDI6_9BACT
MTIVSTVHSVFDLFCGTGGFSAGFEAACRDQFRTALGIDILKDSLATFEANHPDARTLKQDIRTVSCSDIERLTGIRRGKLGVLIGGPPCQGFSSIRPFRSSDEDDPRNTLFEQYANFVNYFRPPVFVMENVVGLATHNNGETIEQIEECFASAGYHCEWRILNSAHFGVPQKRERLILIGAERGIGIVFPSHTHTCNGSTIGHRNKSRMHLPDELPLFSRGHQLPQALSVMDAIGDLPRIESGEEGTEYDRPAENAYQRARRSRRRSLKLHDSTRHTPKMLEIIKHSGPNISYIPKHLISSGFSSCYSRLAADEPSVTITVNFVHPASNRCIHPVADRALTPREGARLQSFDDDFEFRGTRSQIVKQIGNAVPPLLGRAIGLAVAEMLGESTKPNKALDTNTLPALS